VEDAPAAAAEPALLAKEAGAVTRSGKKLVVAPRAGRGVLFESRKLAATKTADGDSTTFAYLGRLGTGALHRVQASFEHDAPGSYLVSPEDGHAMFVHEGSDHVVLSPGRERLVLFNDVNMPLTVVVASLAAGGPKLELFCRAPGEKTKAELKGWKGAETVDLVVDDVPVRLSRAASGWTVAPASRSSLSCTVPSP